MMDIVLVQSESPGSTHSYQILAPPNQALKVSLVGTIFAARSKFLALKIPGLVAL